MRTQFSFLIMAIFCLFSCAKTEQTVEIPSLIISKTVDNEITIDNSFSMDFRNCDNALSFEIIGLSSGYACRVNSTNSVEILDSSTYGYPDALAIDELIAPNGQWSNEHTFVIGTSVGSGGNFEGKGPRYLGFRLLGEQDGAYRYGWILLDNNEGNTSLNVISYGLNYIYGNSIRAGQIE